jgi:DNA ligase D-like protein (predicted 3'-phosphoesterase)
VADKLERYRGKRRPDRTPEPIPDTIPDDGAGDAFVIQEHHARALHWDLRLERDGVLVSWAIPKGLPDDPAVNHLAVHTEDHPMEYLAFEGDIPLGEYGGGSMKVWDRGTYTTEKWTAREVKIVLNGARSSGTFVLFPTKGKNWMIHRMGSAVRDPLPDLAPMLPVTRSRAPRDPGGHAFEFAWGGARLLMPIEGGRTPVGRDHPWLRALAESFGSRTALLDGEVVALGGTEILICYDLLYDDGRALMAEPYHLRRAALEALGIQGARWQTAPSWPGQAGPVRQAAREQNLPGVVAKRLDSPYVAGESTDWVFLRS